MPRTHEFRAAVSWSADAAGPTGPSGAHTRDHAITLPGKPAPYAGSAPALFKGDDAKLSPEDLLLSAVATCHMLSFLAVAAKRGVPVVAYDDEVVGVLELGGGTGRIVAATLRPRVALADGGDPALLPELHAEAHRICFIANSVGFPITVEGAATHG